MHQASIALDPLAVARGNLVVQSRQRDVTRRLAICRLRASPRPWRPPGERVAPAVALARNLLSIDGNDPFAHSGFDSDSIQR